jgi:hypothetical protein
MVVALVRYIEHTQYFELHIPRNAQNKDDVSGKWFQESSDFIMRACPAEVVGFTRERMATCVALKMRRIRALYYRTTAAAHLKWARFYNAFRIHGIAAFTEAIASPKVQDSSACDTRIEQLQAKIKRLETSKERLVRNLENLVNLQQDDDVIYLK